MKSTQIAQTIHNNKSLFTQGSIIPESKILTWFDIKAPDFSKTTNPQAIIKLANTFNFQKLSAQCVINKVLALRGMYMSKSNDTYVIKTKAQVKAKIKSLKNIAKAKKRAAIVLATNLKLHNSVWSKINKSELAN